MISNVERVIKKSMEDAEKQGMEKGMEKRNIEIARQMLAAGEEMEKIVRYTGLTGEEIEKLK